jgi:hypothetical protein
MTEIQPSLFPIRISEGLPEGFEYCEQAISSEHESRVLAQLADLSFKEFQFRGFEGKRRVVSFGWRYDFNDHKVLPCRSNSALFARSLPHGSGHFTFRAARSAASTR